jgi:hypothetical protein
LCIQFVEKIGQILGIPPVQADNGPTAYFGGTGSAVSGTAQMPFGSWLGRERSVMLDR